MTKYEHIRLISITAHQETIIEALNKALSPVDSKEHVCIVCEQISTLHAIICGMKGGVANG